MTAPVREQTAVARTGEPKQEKGIVGLILHDDARKRIEPFLPEGVTVERVAAAAYLVTKQNPQLLECTPESLVMSIARIQQWGLEIGVTAYLVPFRDNKKEILVCTPVAAYTGLAELMIASRAVRHVEARAVYAGDVFKYSQGLYPELYHVPNSDVGSRGALMGAYCILRLPFGQHSFEYMPLEDIDAIRKRYSKQWKDGPCPPWYAKKTVVRQVAKLVPKNPRLAAALRVIDEEREIEFTGRPEAVATPAATPALAPGDEKPMSLDGDEEERTPQSSLDLPD